MGTLSRSRRSPEVREHPALREIENMRGFAFIGLLLIAGGIAALAIPYITYTQNERVVDVGPIKIDAKETKHLPIPEIAAVAAIVAGLGLIFAGSRQAT